MRDRYVVAHREAVDRHNFVNARGHPGEEMRNVASLIEPWNDNRYGKHWHIRIPGERGGQLAAAVGQQVKWGAG